MYLPKHFSVDPDQARQLISEYPFATLIAIADDHSPFVNHLPLILQRDSLLGHMAKNNPQWRHFQKNPNVTVLFHGPHTYITPKWYTSGRDVPTWNYAVVHVRGQVKLIEDAPGITEILKTLTFKFESDTPKQWDFSLPKDLESPIALSSAIVGFEIQIVELQAKFKLSQNRPPQDLSGIKDGLAQRSDEMSAKIKALME